MKNEKIKRCIETFATFEIFLFLLLRKSFLPEILDFVERYFQA